MRDPYDVLGIKRGASFEEVKAAYRKACKAKHPDMGGSHEEMVELNTAYVFILNELKQGYRQRQREEAPQEEARGGAGRSERADRQWEKAYRDIDDELEELRRAAEQHEAALRAMRSRAWEAGEHRAWAKLTWEDFARFIRGIARSGIKGLTLLFAALVGIGSILVESNVVSGIIILGSGIGLLFSLALRSDKGGLMSACLLLFGVMTIWLAPVRAALFTHPLATVSVLVCLGLLLKFAREGGTVGLATGGLLALYMIFVIVADTAPPPRQAAINPPPATQLRPPPAPVAQPQGPAPSPASVSPMSSTPSAPTRPPASPLPPAPSPPPEPRTLLAANGAVLKFVAGVTYHLKVRSGSTTSLAAVQGAIALYSGDQRIGDCRTALDFSVASDAAPYQEIDRTIRACGADAIVRVANVR